MLAWLQRGVAGGFEHLNLRPSWTAWLNTATWQDAPASRSATQTMVASWVD